MTKEQVLPVQNEECCCCLEPNKLYSCGVDNCSWKICEKCYRKVYNDNNDKCPACRNSIEYRIFSPKVKVSAIREINISLDDLERGEMVLREPGCFLWYFLKWRIPCCEFYRNRENLITCRCRRFQNCCECLWKGILYPLLEFIVFWIFIFLCIFIGRWVMWVVDPRFMTMYPYTFWLPFGWFLLAGLLGLLIIAGVICCSSMLYCSICTHSEDDW